MHEVGVAQQIFEIVLENAKENKANKILKVVINVGALSGVEPFSLKFALDAVKADTIANDAVIDVNYVNAKSRCNECGKFSEPNTQFSVCEHCGAFDVELVNGEELEIAYIDVE